MVIFHLHIVHTLPHAKGSHNPMSIPQVIMLTVARVHSRIQFTCMMSSEVIVSYATLTRLGAFPKEGWV
jgi:hypothetical protein